MEIELARPRIPNNWVWLNVGEVVEKIPLTGKKLKQSEYKDNGRFPVIDQGQSFIGGFTDKADFKIIVKKPVIIFGDHTKVFKFVNFDFVPGADGVKVLQADEFFVPKLFYYFLQSISLPEKGYARHFQWLEKAFVPLPPLPEQHRIVAKIEEVFTKLDAGVEALKKVKAQLKRYRQAVLKYAFEGKLTQEWREANKDKLEPASVLLERIREDWEKLTEKKCEEPSLIYTADALKLPEGWKWITSAMIFWFVTSGSRGWAKYYSSTGPIFIRMGNLNHDSIELDLHDIQNVQPPSDTEGTRTRVKANDILISITADIGMVGLVPEKFPEAYINQHVALARAVPSCNVKYLAWFLASNANGQKQLTKLQRGATKIGLGLDDIRSINIPLPSLSEQDRIVNEIEHYFSITDAIEKVIEQNLKQSGRLRQSILKTTFEGKLVPQDPTDEPAEKLLERIKAEKAKKESSTKGRRKKSNQMELK
jgi:type I restriction enzyme S subunit